MHPLCQKKRSWEVKDMLIHRRGLIQQEVSGVNRKAEKKKQCKESRGLTDLRCFRRHSRMRRSQYLCA